MSTLSIPTRQLGLVETTSLSDKDCVLLRRVYELSKRCWSKGQALSSQEEVESFSNWLHETVDESFIVQLQGLGVESIARNREVSAYFHAIKADRLTLFIGRIDLLQLKPHALDRAQACANAARELAETIQGLTRETLPPRILPVCALN